MINELSFNTRKPLNINDEDLDPENPNPLSEKSGCTDMTFCLLCHETSTISRCFNTLPPSVDDYNSPSNELSIEKKISIVTKLQDHLRKKYLVHCDPGNAIALVLIRLTRMIISRMWLAIYHPFQPERRPYVYPALTRDMLLSTSVEILETAHFLEHEPSTAHWRWYFKSWTQWHALAVVLAELCVKNQGPLVARAWNIIDIVFEPWASTIADSRHGMLWRPIRKLMTKAKANRQGILSMDDVGSTPNTTNSDIVFPQLQPSYSDFPAPDLMSISQEMNSNTEAILQDMMIHHQISRNQDILPGFTPTVMPAPTSQQTILDFITQQPTPDFTPQQTLPTFTPSIRATEDAGTINWAEWDEFMQDFEIETGPGQSDKSHQDAKPFGNLWLL